MYDETNVPGPEYRVRPVVRYVVTRYCHPYQSRDGKTGSSGHSEVVAEFDNEIRAHEVASTLSAAEMTHGEQMAVGDADDMADALAQISEALGCQNTLHDILYAIDALDRF